MTNNIQRYTEKSADGNMRSKDFDEYYGNAPLPTRLVLDTANAYPQNQDIPLQTFYFDWFPISRKDQFKQTGQLNLSISMATCYDTNYKQFNSPTFQIRKNSLYKQK
jgi:hypothetical protein